MLFGQSSKFMHASTVLLVNDTVHWASGCWAVLTAAPSPQISCVQECQTDCRLVGLPGDPADMLLLTVHAKLTASRLGVGPAWGL